tara:strand:+ start:2359 stop:3051 length:693 start_codon:yes stop_codon:yes gene_type:complete
LPKIIKMNTKENIINLLKEKAGTKQKVYIITKEVFADIQDVLVEIANKLNKEISNTNISIMYEESGDYDAQLKFSGDTLLFNMHTNIFDFNSAHKIHKSKYVKEDNLRSFCGIINIYNFLSDSLKYNRLNDVGFLIARIFINKDKKFFVEGEKQLGFLFNDFENQDINKAHLINIINNAINYSLNFDLQTPNFNDVKVVSVNQVLNLNNNHKIRTAKRLGFKLSNETNNQ